MHLADIYIHAQTLYQAGATFHINHRHLVRDRDNFLTRRFTNRLVRDRLDNSLPRRLIHHLVRDRRDNSLPHPFTNRLVRDRRDNSLPRRLIRHLVRDRDSFLRHHFLHLLVVEDQDLGLDQDLDHSLPRR